MAAYREVSDQELDRFLDNPTQREGMTVAELERLAERFDWPDCFLSAWGDGHWVPAGTLSRLGRLSRQFHPQASRARKWMAKHDGDIVCVNVEWSGRPAIDVYKQVDDWFWVSLCPFGNSYLGNEVVDLFRGSPALEGGKDWIYYRCDQLTGLIALIEWAIPAIAKA